MTLLSLFFYLLHKNVMLKEKQSHFFIIIQLERKNIIKKYAKYRYH